MEHSLPKARSLLKPKGQILISDVFRLDTPGKSPIGGGHSYRAYLQQRDACGLTCLRDLDITGHIAPTFDVIEDLSLNLLKPSYEHLLRILRNNHPWLARLLLWKFRKRLQRFQKHFRPGRNGEGFARYKTYRLQLLAPEPAAKAAVRPAAP